MYETVWQQLARDDSAEEIHNQWKPVVLKLGRFLNSGSLRLRFTAVADGPKGDVAIDDIELVCGGRDQPGSRCVCNSGYLGDGFNCTIDPNEVFLLIKIFYILFGGRGRGEEGRGF